MDIISIAHAAEAAAEAATEAQNTSVPAMFGLSVKLFIAQLINFGIVVLVLWKWVFPPVVKALEARSARIHKSLEDAKQIAEDKESFEKWKASEIAGARKEAGDIITKAKWDAESIKSDLLAKAKAEQDRVVKQTKEMLEAEQKRSVAEVKEEIATLVVAASEKILRGKLDSKADKELIAESIKKAV